MLRSTLRTMGRMPVQSLPSKLFPVLLRTCLQRLRSKTAYDAFFENEHIIKFKILRVYCQQIAKNNPAFKSIYIYGDGGIR